MHLIALAIKTLTALNSVLVTSSYKITPKSFFFVKCLYCHWWVPESPFCTLGFSWIKFSGLVSVVLSTTLSDFSFSQRTHLVPVFLCSVCPLSWVHGVHMDTHTQHECQLAVFLPNIQYEYSSGRETMLHDWLPDWYYCLCVLCYAIFLACYLIGCHASIQK